MQKTKWIKTIKKEIPMNRKKKYCKFCECLCTFEDEAMCWGCRDMVKELPWKVCGILSRTHFKERTRRYWKKKMRELLDLKHL